RATLAERLKSAEIAFGNFNTVEDFSRHPHLRRIAVETPEGAVRLPAAPALFEDERQPGRVPALGEHTAAVRAEFARRRCAPSLRNERRLSRRRDRIGDLRDDLAEALRRVHPDRSV